MPWVEVDYTAANWTAEEDARPFCHMFYWLDDYVIDDEWSLVSDPTGEWVPA